jgi:hypothetical protein
MVVRASESLSSVGLWGSVRACQPTTEKKSLSPGAAVDRNLTRNFRANIIVMNTIFVKRKNAVRGECLCIPEKIIWGDSDFVETFRDEGSPSLYATHALPSRTLLSRRRRGVRNLNGW